MRQQTATVDGLDWEHYAAPLRELGEVNYYVHERLGKPLIVSDVGAFSELPDDAVLKVPVDEHEVPVLEAALGFAAEHGDALGAAARGHVQHEHSLEHVAQAYAGALETAAGADAVDDAVLWRIAEAATEVGIDDAGRLARAAVDAGIVT